MKKLFFLLIILFSTVTSITQPSDIDTLKYVNPDLYYFVKNWIGTRYRFGGNTKNGIDCSGLSKKLYNIVFCKTIPRTAKEQYVKSKKIKKDSLETGDLLFFKTKGGSTWHVGIYLIDNFFIHSGSSKTGVHITSINEEYYRKTFLGGGRL